MRDAALLLAAIAMVAGLYLSLGPPRVLWLNTGLSIGYEWKRGAASFLAGAGAAGLAGGIRPRGGRVILAALAAAFAVFGAYRLAYRVEAVEDALRVRTLLGTTSLPWASITRVDITPGELALTSDRGTTQVETADLTADQRAALERTVARRVREAGDLLAPERVEK